MFFIILVASFLVIQGVELSNLPPSITPCSLSDVQFEKCALGTANNFFKNIVLGDFKIPPLYLNNSRDVSINVTNARLEGLENIKFSSLKKIPSKNRIEGYLTTSAKLYGDFIVDITVGKVTVVGKGPAVVALSDIAANIAFDWKITERKGIKYTDVTNIDVTLHPKYSKFQFEGESGKALNDRIGSIIDQIVHEIIPSGVYYAKRIFHRLTDTLFAAVPHNELFLA